MITVSNLTKGFHKQPPLWDNLSFDVPWAQRLREIHPTQLHWGAGNPRLR